jgi:ketosteroid isomerase-like protein/mono/diheme cytochrome c family protein
MGFIMKKHIKHHSITVIVVLALLAVGAGVFVYSGVYNIGADDHHTEPVFTVLQTLRDRSIHLRSKDIVVPNLEDPQLILKGAGQYAAMCTQCHLKPGMQDSEIRPGLYPQPPNLSQTHIDPKDAFWVIKHGLKMSAMPAWGGSHDDPTIWSMVAFLQKLPAMSAAQYMDMGDGDGHSHSHGGDADEAAHSAADMPGMEMPADGGHSHAATGAGGHQHVEAAATAGDSANATAVAEAPLSLAGLTPKSVPEAEAAARAFQAALQRGDRAAVLALLAPEVSVSEGGHTQSHDEYANGHLGEDIAFLKDATITPISLGSMRMGDTAMVGSESTITIVSKGKSVSLRSLEMLTLKQVGAGWKIVTIQWQSTPIADKAP